jgi:hypothetical protein
VAHTFIAMSPFYILALVAIRLGGLAACVVAAPGEPDDLDLHCATFATGILWNERV